MGHPLEDILDSWMDMLNAMQHPRMYRNTRLSQIADGVEMGEHGTIGDWEDRNGDVAITVDMPGVQKKDINLTVDKHMVKVQAKAADRDYSFEKEFNSFTTTLDPSKVTANFNNGVLDITIKKAEESQGKKIAIK